MLFLRFIDKDIISVIFTHRVIGPHPSLYFMCPNTKRNAAEFNFYKAVFIYARMF